LKRGVTFHDGKPFDAEDVKFTFSRLQDPKAGIAHPEYYRDIETVMVVDSHTIKIKDEKVTRCSFFNLARGDSMIVNVQAVDKLKTAPVGTGPSSSWSGHGETTLR